MDLVQGRNHLRQVMVNGQQTDRRLNLVMTNGRRKDYSLSKCLNMAREFFKHWHTELQCQTNKQQTH